MISSFKRFDVDSLGDASDWMNKHSKLWGGTPNHGYGYITRGTSFGVEHFFSKDVFKHLIFD